MASGGASPGDLQVPVAGRAPVRLPAAELRWRFSRSSGPGGQHVNTTDSRVELIFDLAASEALPPLLRARALQRLEGQLLEGCVVISASEQRSQWQNRVAAQRRLVALLQEALRPPPPPRRPTRPTRGSVQRRLEAKQRRSAVKRQRGGRIPPSED
jgi:ribosome-associated protein